MTSAPRRSRLAWLAFPLFILAILALVLVFRERLLEVFRDRERLRAWILARGAGGWLVFVGLQALQVVLFIIPGDIVQAAGGYVFGFWRAVLLSATGITLGASFNFAAGRIMGRPFVEVLFGREKVVSIERVAASGRASAAFFLLFVIPGLPKDALCYVAGVSRLSFPVFFLISMIGRLPGIMGSSMMGSAAQRGSYGLALGVLAGASVLFFLGLFFRERVQALLVRVLHRGRPEGGGPAGDGPMGGGPVGDGPADGDRAEPS